MVRVKENRKVTPMTTVGALLTAYDKHMRGVQPKPPAWVRYERDGPLRRVAGGHRGYICGPRDVGVTGAELDRLIARQRDYFAARGEAVGWPIRAHDQPAASPACWAARHCRSGAAAASTGRWLPPGPSGPPHAASRTCRPTPPPTVPPFCAAWDSAR